MISVSDIQHASPAVREKAKRTWIKKLAANQFRVVPKSRSKSKRIVVFLPTNQVLCVSRDTGEICQANYFGMVCHHVFKAADHLVKLAQRNVQKPIQNT